MKEKKEQTTPEEKDIQKNESDKNFQVTSTNEISTPLDQNENEETSEDEVMSEKTTPEDTKVELANVDEEVKEVVEEKSELLAEVNAETASKEKAEIAKDEKVVKKPKAELVKVGKTVKEKEDKENPEVKSKISASDENTYSLEEDEMDNDEDDNDEEVGIDIAAFDSFNLDQAKDEAVRLLQEETDIYKIRPAIIKLHEIHSRLILEERGKLDHSDEEEDEIHKDAIKQIDKKEADFVAVWNLFKEKRKEYFNQLEAEREDNFNEKLALLEDLKNLIDTEEPLKKTFDEFKNIQEKWREIGMVPKEKNNELWLNYNHFVGLFLEKVNMYHELRDLDKKKNMEIKVELCEKAEALILDKSPHESFKKLQDLHRLWKETGPVPQEHNDELWERFKVASEKIREARIGYYEEMKKKQEANLEAKTALVEKTRSLASAELNSIKEWNAKTKEINELFQLWRSIGRAPKEHNDKVWIEFKGILDAFFAARKEYFDDIRQEYDDNYNKKLNICMQAEAVKESTEWNKTANELKRYQEEWKKIGPVPRAKSNVIWQRFRAACDYFFERKNDYFKNLKKNEAENYKNKKKLIEEFVKYEFSKDKKQNLEAIHDFQRRWFEIGRVPFEKKDEIQREWRKIVDETLEKLKISRFESDNKRFKERIENLADSKGGQNELRDELRRLSGKIKKVEQDVILWENNLSFFRSSKNADILLKEYHDKIDAAKVDIKVMKEKQKFLKNQIQ